MELFDIYSMARDVGFLVAIGLLLARVRQLSHGPVSLGEAVMDHTQQINELRAESNARANAVVEDLNKARDACNELVAKHHVAQGVLKDEMQVKIEQLGRELKVDRDAIMAASHDAYLETQKRLSWLEEAAAAKAPTAPAPKAKADDSEKSLEKVRRALKKKARK